MTQPKGAIEMNKIEALNALPVTDYSCTGEECEYVMTYNTEKVKNHLLDAGFTEEEINEASDGLGTDLDISHLAFNYTEANWWMVKGGFGFESDSESTEFTQAVGGNHFDPT